MKTSTQLLRIAMAAGCLLCICGASPLFAQKLRIDAVVEPKGPVFGENILYGLVVTYEGPDAASRSAPEVPELLGGEGFRFDYVETREQRTRESSIMINGRFSKKIEKTWVVVYRLVPDRPGTILIPAQEIEIFGAKKRFGSRAIDIAKEAPGNKICDIRVEVSPERPYVNEALRLRFILECEKPMSEVEIELPWAKTPNGFGGDPVSFGWTRGRGAAVNLNGERFDFRREPHSDPNAKEGQRLVFERVLYPLAPGPVEIQGASARLQALLRYRRSFGGGLRPVKTAKAVLSTPNLMLEVRDAPIAGRPASYTGVIGNFSGIASLGKTEIRAGDGVTLRLQLSGRGELSALTAPDLGSAPEFADFDVYPPDRELEKSEDGSDATLTLSWLLVPKAGTEDPTFPEWEFGWFAPSKEEFRTVSVGPAKIEIKGEVAREGIFAGGAANAREAREILVLGEGLRPLVENPESLGRPFRSVPFGWVPAVLFGGPLCLWLLGSWSRRHARVSQDSDLMRRKFASKEARARLEEARAALDDGRRFPGKLRESLAGFVSDKLGVPAARITASSAPAMLSAASVSDESADELAAMLERLEAAEFGATAAEIDERQRQFDEAAALVGKLDREIRRS